MSGWIKMGVGLRRHPKVVRIASALKADRLRVVGALHAVWCVFDEHSNDGRLDGYTAAIMDEEIGWRGFSRAMEAIGWLEESDAGLVVPDYEEHNGPTAKRRALDSQRKGQSRKKSDDEQGEEGGCDPQPVRTKSGHADGNVSASDADKTKNREEKRREEEEKRERAQPASRGQRLPPGWTPEPAHMAFAESLGLRNGKALAELEKFRDYWAAQPGQKGVKTDWPATWRNWARRAVEDAAGRAKPVTADFLDGVH